MAADRKVQGENSQSARGLSIYGYPQCPFCRRVLDAVDSLGLEIPLRNIMEDVEHHRELLEAMGRATVPVLLVEDEGREPRWVPESADIVRYLVVRFAGKS